MTLRFARMLWNYNWFSIKNNAELCEQANKLDAIVLQVTGEGERSAKNKHIPTGDIEIIVSELSVLNEAITHPLPLKTKRRGDDLRMKYRYLI